MNPFAPRQHRPISEGETRRKAGAKIAGRVTRSEATSVRHALRNLSPTEREYVNRRAKGESAPEAYKQVTGDSRNSSRLEAKPQVQHALAAVETQVLRGSLMTMSQKRDYVLDRLKTECETAKDAVRVRALELLGKTAGLWTEAREEPIGGADAIKQRLEELIASVRGRTIEYAQPIDSIEDVVPDAVPLEAGQDEVDAVDGVSRRLNTDG
jgi:hypothetical protein